MKKTLRFKTNKIYLKSKINLKELKALFKIILTWSTRRLVLLFFIVKKSINNNIGNYYFGEKMT